MDYIDALYGFAMVLTIDTNTAADLVQETYVQALRHWRQYAPGTNLKAWMFVILRNLWLNQHKRARSRPQFVSVERWQQERGAHALGLASTQETPEASLLRSLQIEQVQLAIESLPADYREVIILRELEGFSYKEIAIILQCAEGTVMSRLNRARHQLRNYLAKVIGQ